MMPVSIPCPFCNGKGTIEHYRDASEVCDRCFGCKKLKTTLALRLLTEEALRLENLNHPSLYIKSGWEDKARQLRNKILEIQRL